jgi:hypothetical protein
LAFVPEGPRRSAYSSATQRVLALRKNLYRARGAMTTKYGECTGRRWSAWAGSSSHASPSEVKRKGSELSQHAHTPHRYHAGMFAENKYMPGGGPEGSPPGSPGQTQKVVFDATGGGNREKGLNMKATIPKTGKVRSPEEAAARPCMQVCAMHQF